jgi:heme-degrading monooxygenase HmoA
MIIVHETFNCKPGNASKLAKMFKDAMTGRKEFVQVLTDVTGPYNKVIIVTQFENLGAYDKSWETANPEEMKKMQEAMKGYTDMYLTGSREIYKVW